MERRSLLKRLGIGAGIVGAGVVLPSLAAETLGPNQPETDDPRPASFWEEDSGPFPATEKIESDLDVDVAIIGAGITGLSAALALKKLRPELKVAVIDSHRPCSGSSSRNSGHLIAEHHAWQSILSSKGPEAAKEWNGFARRGLEFILEFLRSENIECDLRQDPLVSVATKGQLKALDKLAAKMKESGKDVALLKGKDFQDHAGTDFYHGGIEDASGWLMHPGKLMKGVLAKAIAAGAQVYGDSPVLEVAMSDSGTEANILSTPKGTVTAKNVLFATNAYTPRLNGLLSSRMIPVHVAIVCTRPMTPNERKSAGFAWENLKEISILSRTMGVTPDNRVFLRGILGYLAFNSCVWKDPRKDYARLEAEMRQRLPWTKGLEVTHRWYGPVAMNTSAYPAAGAIAGRGRHVCAAYNGVGMMDGFYHAMLVAHNMVGADHPDLKYLKGPEQAGWIPPEPGRSIGAKSFFVLGM